NGSMIEEVVTEFREMADAKVTVTAGGLERARTLLEESLGGDKATEILDRVTASLIELPFEFLRRADPRQVLSFIQDEHPQTIALVLAYMTPDQAAMVMSGLAEDLQRDVAMRLAVMDRTSPEVVAHVETQLERKLSSVLQPSELSSVGGVQSLVDILNRSDRATERLILEGLENNDSELADEVRQRMFVFEDIAGLDDRSIQLVLRQVDSKELAVALKGGRQEVRGAITRNTSARAGANLGEENALPSVPVDPARARVEQQRGYDDGFQAGLAEGRAAGQAAAAAESATVITHLEALGRSLVEAAEDLRRRQALELTGLEDVL